MPSGVRIVDEINQQADVLISSLQNNDVLTYNSSIQKWENKTSATIDSLLPSQSGNADKFLKTNGSSVQWGTPSSSGSSDLSKTFTYDINDRLSSITDSAGTKTITYSLDGLLSQIVGTGPYPTKTFSYDINGKLTGITVL